MFIVGRKADESIVDVSPRYGQANPGIDIVLNNIVISHGGSASDYDVFYIGDSSAECQRIMDRHSFELVWDGEAIASLDFSIEDAKKWLKVEADKTVVKRDGVDSIAIVGTVFLADKVTVDTEFNETILVPIKTPQYAMKLKATFNSGVCSHTLVTEQFGEYVYPSAGKYVDDLRVVNQIKIDSVYEVLGV